MGETHSIARTHALARTHTHTQHGCCWCAKEGDKAAVDRTLSSEPSGEEMWEELGGGSTSDSLRGEKKGSRTVSSHNAQCTLFAQRIGSTLTAKQTLTNSGTRRTNPQQVCYILIHSGFCL